MVSSVNALNGFVTAFFFSLAVMRNPVVCNKGHTICEKCLETAMFKGNGNCPVDRTFVGAVLPVRNLALQSMIDKLQMKCPNEAGCSWSGPLESVPQHLKECPMEMVKCTNTNCTVSVYRYELSGHLEKCPHRTKDCQHCGAKVKLVNLPRHNDNCPKVALECPNKCGVTLLRYVIQVFSICFI